MKLLREMSIAIKVVAGTLGSGAQRAFIKLVSIIINNESNGGF